MGTRFKLRMCTWNVGNAQPPPDLTAWLGIGENDYDIVAVGAQEANYGADKIPSPTSVSSPYSNVEHFSPSPAHDAQVSPSRVVTSDAVAISTSSRLRKLSRVVRSATGTWKENTAKLRRIRSRKNEEPVPEANKKATWCRSEDEDEDDGDGTDSGDVQEDDDIESTSDEDLRTRFDTGKNASSMNNSAENVKQRVQRSKSANSFSAYTVDEFCVPVRAFDELDETSIRQSERRFRPIARSNVKVSDARCQDQEEGSSLVVRPLVERRASTGRDAIKIKGGAAQSSSDSGTLQRGTDSEEEGSNLPGDMKEEKVHRMENRIASPLLRSFHSQRKLNAEDAHSSQNAMSRKKFSQTIEKAMPLEYQLVAKHHLMEIKLLIFIHERHKWRVVRTQGVSEATGIANMVGNKGGVGVKLTLDDTTFCFICSHLAAHEGAKFLQQRNDDVVEIMRNIERNKVHGLPAIHQFNHVFWMGDLNYRLDVRRAIPAAVTWSHEERWSYVLGLVAKRRYEELAKLDELIHEMAEERVFAGFAEGPIRFPPTFKVNRGKSYASYQTLRVPSYCDRILWHSLPMHKNHIKLKEYSCVSAIDTSDHKPVYAVFDLVIPKRITCFPLPAPRDTLKCTLDFASLRVHGLYEKRGDGDDATLQYEVLEDGALALVGESDGAAGGSPGSHTRRVVHADFHGAGLFVRERGHRAEVPLRAGGVRGCAYDELPKIALRPVRSLADLTYKYVTVVFTRLGSRQGSSCVLPVARLVRQPGRHAGAFELDLTKYGHAVASVRVEVELVASLETWVDSRNRKVKVRR